VHYAAKASRLQGFDCTTLVYQVYSINNRSLFDVVCDIYERTRFSRLLLPYLTFIRSAMRYDVFCLYFDGGLLYATPWWRAELMLLRRSGARIIALPYGGDARLPSVARSRQPWNILSEVPASSDAAAERRVQPRLKAFGCADVIEELPRVDGIYRFPYEHPTQIRVAAERRDHLVVVHAPNHRVYKGSHFLVEAVDELHARGVRIELDLVEGVPNEEALRRYAAADIVADQFLAGAYALFAIEGMALGKPVISYLDDRLRKWHPEWEECPIISASPDDLMGALQTLILDEVFRGERGALGPRFVQRHHSLDAVGKSLAGIYETLA
jgi:glycosyltransferase involved in cell wall biosynthesis